MSNVKPNDVMDSPKVNKKKLAPTLSQSNLDDSYVSRSQQRPSNVRESGGLSVPSQKKGARRGSNRSGGSDFSRKSIGSVKSSQPKDTVEMQVKRNKHVNFAQEKSFDPTNVAAVQRSFMLTNNDRHQLELQHMRPLQSGGGFGGNSQNYEQVGLMQKKQKFFGNKEEENKNKKLPQGQQLLDKTGEDGVYIDALLKFKNQDVNVQKLEERILNTYQENRDICRAEIYFEPNGEIKLKNDLMAAELTRPVDQAFEQTDAFQTIEHNAIVTDRLNSFKRRYYKIDIIVGKLILQKFDLFSEEDQKVMNLKQMCKHYDRRVQQALIPFYQQRIEFLTKELAKDENTQKDIDLLETLKKEITKERMDETEAIKQQANAIYKLWREIEDLRDGKTPQTNAKLTVHPGRPKGTDVLFNINESPQQGEMGDEKANRKAKTERTMIHVNLLIDGQRVAESFEKQETTLLGNKKTKTHLNYPSYEADLLEQFQLYVFTLPHQVQLEICFNDKVIDTIDVEIPGAHVNTLTSASKLINEINFKNQQQKDIEEYDKLYPALPENANDDQKKAYLEDKDRLAAEKKLKKNQCIEGQIFVKAEWEGAGGDMPPASSRTIFSMGKLNKNRHEFDKDAVTAKLLDVNDPRNVEIMSKVQMMKNDYLEQLMKNDSKFQLHEMNGLKDSVRHKLLKARMNDPLKSEDTIPQLCAELIHDDRSKYYIEWLEGVYSDLAAREIAIANSQNDQMGQSKGIKQIDKNAFDDQTKNRRMDIKMMIDQRKKEGKQGTANRNQQKQYPSVVEEVQFDPEQDWLGIIKNYFTFARKLKPKIKKKHSKDATSLSQIKIVFNILRGSNVPIRLTYYEDATELNENQQSKIGQKKKDNLNEKFYWQQQCQTLVEVRIVNPDPDVKKADKETVLETKIADGQYPEWNENLQYVLKAQNGKKFRSDELSQSPIMIYFTLFDQFQETEELTKAKSITIKEKRYLGSFAVPLTTILADDKFEGQIRLNRPLVLQDYRVINDDIFNKVTKGDYDETTEKTDESIPTYLQLSVSCQPFVQIPRDNEKEYYGGKESGDFLDAGTLWARKIQDYYKKRQKPRTIKVFLVNLDNKSIFIPRLLVPLMPPLGLTKTKKDWSDEPYAIEMCARFVSLIPFADDSSLFEGLPDMTCTAQQFLDLGAGDSEEHAILLCNYFNYIDRDSMRKIKPDERFGDIESYVCYCDAVPNGEGWFVLRRNKSKIKEPEELKDSNTGKIIKGNIPNYTEIWDASTGECFVFGADNNDPQCPIKKLWCVVGMDNIWANVQYTDIPQMMSFDLENKKDWQPFLDDDLLADYFQSEAGPSVYHSSRERAKFQAKKFKNKRKKDPNCLPTKIVQEEKVIYSVSQGIDVHQLEGHIKRELCGKFEDERIAAVKKTTNWFRQADKLLREIFKTNPKEFASDFVDKMEQKAKRGKDQTLDTEALRDVTEGAMSDMETYMCIARQGGTSSLLRGDLKDSEQDIKLTAIQYMLNKIGEKYKKKIWAIPVNTTLTRLDDVWEKLKQTRMHEIDDSEAQFSLSVMIKDYPCNIYSVWMYIAVFRNNDADD